MKIEQYCLSILNILCIVYRFINKGKFLMNAYKKKVKCIPKPMTETKLKFFTRYKFQSGNIRHLLVK